MIRDGFAVRCAGSVPYYACIALERIAGVSHGFSTRAGGVPSPRGDSLNLGLVPWDDPDRVAGNRARFFASLGLESVPLATLSQVHSNRVHTVEEMRDSTARPEGDALVTRMTGVALGVLVADCFPVLLADPGQCVIAAVHSGWRGTAGRIVAKTVEKMMEQFGSEASGIIAAIGPGIRSCCLEVGPDVTRLFAETHPGDDLVRPRAERPGKFLLDLPQALKTQLVDVGLPQANIYDLGLCTRCHPAEFFSYRGEGPLAGRLMGVIARTGN